MSEQIQERSIDAVLPNLGQYYGTQGYMRHKILPTMNKGLILTDGARYVAEAAGAWWLMDHLMLRASEWLLQSDGFCTVKVSTTREEGAHVEVTDGEYEVLDEETFDLTDFPLGLLQFYLLEMETDKGIEPVLMLTTEY